MEIKSEFVISASVFLESGLPFKYKTASTRVTNSKQIESSFLKLALSIIFT